MPRYRVDVDEIVEATGPTELVEKLRRDSRVPVASSAAFRLRAAYWGQRLYAVAIRTGTDDEFVEDMLRHGLFSLAPEEAP